MRPELQKLREALFKDLYKFLKFVWPIIEPGTPLADAPYIRLICQHLEAITHHVEDKTTTTKSLIINIPPASLKSTIVTKVWPAWCWVRNPSLDIINASYSRNLAISHALASRDIITHEVTKALFPYLRLRPDSTAKTEYTNTMQGERRATSVGGTLTGFHGDIVIVDDPIKPSDAESAAVMEATNNWYTRTLPSRVKTGGAKVLVMQRLHEKDPTALQAEEPNTTHLILPAWADVLEENTLEKYYIDGLLNPARMPRQFLQSLKRTLGERTFAAQYEQSPRPQSGNIFDPEKFTRYAIAELTQEHPDIVWHFALDTAYTRKTSNSASVCVAFAYIDGHYYIRDVMREWLNFSALIKKLTQFIQRNGYTTKSRIFIEPKASGKDVVDVLRHQGLNAMDAPAPTTDKIANAYSIQPIADAGRIAIPHAAPWVHAFLNELSLFPFSTHDDQVDAVVLMVKAMEAKRRRIKAFG